MCLITRVSNNHFLFTSINVKIALADIVSICSVRTVLVDWDQHFTILVIQLLTGSHGDVRNDFLLRLPGFSLFLALFWVCDRSMFFGHSFHLVLVLALLVALCNVTSFTVSCVRILLRSCGSEGYDSRDRSLWLFASFFVIDVYLRHRHEPHDIAVQSYLPAHLRCAAYFSRVFPCWLFS